MAGGKRAETAVPRPRSGSRAGSRLLDDVRLETLDECDHVALLSLRHLELRQGRGGMAEENGPVDLADAHPLVSEQHVPATIVHWPARACTEVVDQKLFLAHDPVFAPVRPETPELRICPQAREQIVRHRRDRVVPTQALVEGRRLVAHRSLLESMGTWFGRAVFSSPAWFASRRRGHGRRATRCAEPAAWGGQPATLGEQMCTLLSRGRGPRPSASAPC